MPHPTSPNRIAVFGLGIIGSRAATNLGKAGFTVSAWNRTPKDRSDFVADPIEAARAAEVVALYLKDAPAVREVFAKIRPTLGPDRVLMNHATIDLETTQNLEAECIRLGCPFLNAPFTGSKTAAESGALVYYAGGEAALRERLRPLLAATSSRIMDVETPTAATVLKLTTNLLSATTVQALAEALALNRAYGNSPQIFGEAVQSNACSSVLTGMKLPGMAQGDFDPHFSLSNMLKDARYMLDLAQRAELSTPGIATTAARMQELEDAGLGDRDFSVLARQFDQPS